ncbi:MAG: hypothetical protein M3Y46_10750, partial [Actinomycetota bacterium]|nr:hypothetical protein [Chloroflexota bacterium]MDQ2699262.1 hypothetical protein [Actinomycetota bacterium]
MLSPSWPNPANGRRSIPPRVRRRVNAAERRALRRAVSLGAAFMAVIMVGDVAVNVVLGATGALQLA